MVSRSGFLLKEEDILSAADGSESKAYSKDLDKVDAEAIRSITEEMQETVRSVAERILAGEAYKSPSEDACRFCPIADNCDVACREKK